MGNKLVIFLALFAINALIYSCGISNNFINLDDYIYVGHNVKVQSISLENIKWAFTTIYFGHYSPLLWLSYMLDYYIGNGEAIIFHIHNLIIQIINAYLVFLCTNLILKNRLKSFFVSLFFSILALNIEPVVWVSSRKDLLNGFYFFLTMLFYLIYKENKNKKFLFFTFISMLLGALVKSSIVFFTFVMFLIDYLYNFSTCSNKKEKLTIKISIKLFLEKIPFIILSIITVYAGIVTQTKWGAIYNYKDLSIIKKIYNASFYVLSYIRRVFFPSDLSIMYDHPYDTISNVKGIIFIFLILFFIIFSYIYRKKNPLFIFSLFFFFFTILPYLQISQIGIQAIADRWCYIPKFGVVLFLFAINKKLLKPLVSILIIINLYFGIPYLFAWKDSVSLYEYTLNNNYKNHVVYRLLAKSYNHLASETKEYKKYEMKSLNNIIESINYNILDIESFNMFLNKIKNKKGRYNDLLITFIDRLFKVNDNTIDNMKYISIILADLASNKVAIDYIKDNYKKHPLEIANDYLNDAMKKDSKNLELYIAYLKIADYAKIRRAVIKTIEKLFPDNQRTQLLKCYDAYNMEDYDNAIKELKKNIEFSPSTSESYDMLSNIYLEKNDFPNAKKYIKLALASSNNNATYKAKYYNILLKQGKKKLVIRKLLNDVALKTYNIDILNILADIYKDKKLYKKALEIYKLALKEDKSIELYDSVTDIYKKLNYKHLYEKYKRITLRAKNRIKNAPKASGLINVIINRY